jgi:electron transport complex protein RnfG
MNEYVKPTLILAAITLCAGLLLAGVNSVTYQQIEMLNEQKEKDALAKVLPGFEITDTNTAPEGELYWSAKNSDNVKGYAFISEGPGYSGTIRVMVGVDSNLNIVGISILAQTETPGLGARCIEVQSSNTFLDVITGNLTEESDPTPWFQKQFRMLDGSRQIFISKKGDWNESIARELLENNEVSAITGATITTKAVRDIIESGIEKYRSIITE